MPRRTFRYRVQRIREWMLQESQRAAQGAARRYDLSDGRKGTLAEALADLERRGLEPEGGELMREQADLARKLAKGQRAREFARKLAAEHDLDIEV